METRKYRRQLNKKINVGKLQEVRKPGKKETNKDGNQKMLNISTRNHQETTKPEIEKNNTLNTEHRKQ